MPRVDSKRNTNWGTGFRTLSSGKKSSARLKKDLSRVTRDDDWRRKRNERRRDRQALEAK